MLISPSVAANGMGQTYGALWADDPMAGTFNPAAVGLFTQKNRFGISIYPHKIKWPDNMREQWPYNAHATVVGLYLSQSNIPIHFGIGYFGCSHRKKPRTSGADYIDPDEFSERINGLTFSMAIEYGIQISLGYSVKYFESQWSRWFETDIDLGITAFAHDFGFIAQAPLFSTMLSAPQLQWNNFTITPFLTPGYFISLRNIGPKLKVKDASWRDPLPRQFYTGISLQAGLHIQNGKDKFDLLHVHWSREADDTLVKGSEDGRTHYLTSSRHINFWDDIILRKSNTDITSRFGYEIGVADLLFIRAGHFRSPYEANVDTRGFGLNLTQPLRILSMLIQNEKYQQWFDILSTVDIEYHSSVFKANEDSPFIAMDGESIVIKLKNIEF